MVLIFGALYWICWCSLSSWLWDPIRSAHPSCPLETWKIHMPSHVGGVLVSQLMRADCVTLPIPWFNDINLGSFKLALGRLYTASKLHVLISYWFCNKLLWAWWLKTTQISSLLWPLSLSLIWITQDDLEVPDWIPSAKFLLPSEVTSSQLLGIRTQTSGRDHCSVYFSLKRDFYFQESWLLNIYQHTLSLTPLYLYRLVEKTLIFLMALPFWFLASRTFCYLGTCIRFPPQESGGTATI